MKTLFRILRSFQFATGLLCLTYFLAACGGDPLPAEEEEDPGTSGTSSATSTGTVKKPTKPTASTSSSTKPPAATVPVDNTDQPVVPPHEPVIDPDYPGLDVAMAPDAEVDGCTDGYDEKKATLTLKLTADVPGVRLSAKDGVLLANGHACGEEQKASLDILERIQVTGGKEDNVVILDLSEGDFGSKLYETAGGFYFTLGDGTDLVMLRGTEEDDKFFFGSGTKIVMAALSETARINLWAKNTESLIVSSGPGNDQIDAIGRLNVGLFDVDSGATVQPTELAIAARYYGGDGNDVLVGGVGNDLLVGGAGDDEADGSDGDDTFDEGPEANGADVINGGAGSDQLDYRSRENDLKLQLCLVDGKRGCGDKCQCTHDNGETGEGDTLINVERIWGGSGNDTIIGTSADESLYAEFGDDKLSGGAGSDLLQGGEGNDEFDGGDGGDICDADPDEVKLECEI